MTTTDDAKFVLSKLVQLACDLGLRIVRRSQYVSDFRSENGRHNYEFSYMPFGRAHVDIELNNLLEEDDRPHWAHIVAACEQANQQCKNVYVVPVSGSQVSVKTEIPLEQFNLKNIADMNDRMAELHDGAANFFRILADIEMEADDDTIPACVIEPPEHLQ